MKPILNQSKKANVNQGDLLVAIDHHGVAREVTTAGWGLRTTYYTVRNTFSSEDVIRLSSLNLRDPRGDQRIEFTPKVTIEGISSVAKLASSLRTHLNSQKVFLKRVFDEVLEEFSRDSANPLSSFYEPGISMHWNELITSRVEDRIGLKIKIQLLFDGPVEEWLNKLKNLASKPITFTFIPQKAGRKIKIGFSYRFAEIDYAHWYALKRRALVQRTIEQEVQDIESRLKTIMDTLLYDWDPAVFECANPNFWNYVATAINEKCDQEIGEEFGILLKISSMKPKLNPLHKTIHDNNHEVTLHDLDHLLINEKNAREQFSKILEASNYDMEHPEVIKMKKTLENIRQYRKSEYNRGIRSQMETPEALRISTSDLHLLENTLTQMRKTLNLPPVPMTPQLTSYAPPQESTSPTSSPILQILEDRGYTHANSLEDAAGARTFRFNRKENEYTIQVDSKNRSAIRSVTINGNPCTQLDLNPGKNLQSSLERVLDQLEKNPSP